MDAQGCSASRADDGMLPMGARGDAVPSGSEREAPQRLGCRAAQPRQRRCQHGLQQRLGSQATQRACAAGMLRGGDGQHEGVEAEGHEQLSASLARVRVKGER